jgi:uncharacterized protein YkwD
MRGAAKTFLIAVSLAAVLVAAFPATSEAASSPREMRRKLLALTNKARRNDHLRTLELNWPLSKSAARHSRRMRERHTVYHTANLYRLVRRWRPSTWGENVGMAGTVRRVHKLFMRSSPHRSNILRGGYSRVGIGVVRGGGRIWATVIFYGS